MPPLGMQARLSGARVTAQVVWESAFTSLEAFIDIDRRARVIEQGATRIVASELLTATGVRVLVFEGTSGQHVTSLYPREWHALTDNALLALLDIARLHTKRLSQQLL